MKLRSLLFTLFVLVCASKAFSQFQFPLPVNPQYFADWDKNQRQKEIKSQWVKKNRAGLDLNEVAFVNWNAGGANSVSALAEMSFERNYSDIMTKFRNRLVMRYGVNSQEDRELRKTDDKLEFNSEFGHRKDSSSNWFYSAKFRLQTQFTNGYNYPDRDNPISKFMAPGYGFLGVGAEYGKKLENLSIYLSPVTYKATFVFDQDLANKGAFGVEGAQYNEAGEIIREGKTNRSEVGILVQSQFNARVVENIALSNNVTFYTDYLNSFGNVDVDWEVNFNFKVNSFVLAKLGSHLKYDNDVKFTEKNDAGETIAMGARTQWKQQLGIGVIVDF